MHALSQKGSSLSLLRKKRVFAWFLEELRKHKLSAAGTLLLALASSVLTEVVLPLTISQFMHRITEGRGLSVPIGLIASSIGIALTAPFSVAAIRRFEYVVRHGLANRVRDVLLSRTNTLTRQGAELDSAVKTFLESWSRMGVAFFMYCPVLVVALVGMITVMALRAPFMVVVLSVVAVLSAVAAMTVGRFLWSTWGARMKAEHRVNTAFADMVLSHAMLWVLKVTSRRHLEAMDVWAVEARRHSRSVLAWQAASKSLTYLLLIGAAVGGVVLNNSVGVRIDTSFLLVWFSVMMMSHINSLFLVSEAFGASLVEAEAMVAELDRSERKPLPNCTAVQQITFRGVTVARPPEPGKEHLDRAPIEYEDMTFRPGLTVFTGPNGCGKSTALMAMTGLLSYEGSILYETEAGAIEARDVDARRFSILSTQGNVPFESLTIASLFDGASANDIYEALGWAGFSDKIPIDRSLCRLSGGERRMVYNAAAMHAACASHVLIMDEPTNDLSAYNIGRFASGLEEFMLDNSHVIVILVSHDKQICAMTVAELLVA